MSGTPILGPNSTWPQTIKVNAVPADPRYSAAKDFWPNLSEGDADPARQRSRSTRRHKRPAEPTQFPRSATPAPAGPALTIAQLRSGHRTQQTPRTSPPPPSQVRSALRRGSNTRRIQQIGLSAYDQTQITSPRPLSSANAQSGRTPRSASIGITQGSVTCTKLSAPDCAIKVAIAIVIAKTLTARSAVMSSAMGLLRLIEH